MSAFRKAITVDIGPESYKVEHLAHGSIRLTLKKTALYAQYAAILLFFFIGLFIFWRIAWLLLDVFSIGEVLPAGVPGWLWAFGAIFAFKALVYLAVPLILFIHLRKSPREFEVTATSLIVGYPDGRIVDYSWNDLRRINIIRSQYVFSDSRCVPLPAQFFRLQDVRSLLAGTCIEGDVDRAIGRFRKPAVGLGVISLFIWIGLPVAYEWADLPTTGLTPLIFIIAYLGVILLTFTAFARLNSVCCKIHMPNTIP